MGKRKIWEKLLSSERLGAGKAPGSAASDGVNRKEQKRLEADARNKLAAQRKPLQNKQNKLDKDMATLNSEKAELDAFLLLEEAYQEHNKARLAAALKRQGELTAQLEELEREAARSIAAADGSAALEELRGLVGRINNTAEQVSSASTQARDIATRLLTASEAQSQEIKDTGDKVLRMAAQINDVSKGAAESAKVARASSRLGLSSTLTWLASTNGVMVWVMIGFQ